MVPPSSNMVFGSLTQSPAPGGCPGAGQGYDAQRRQVEMPPMKMGQPAHRSSAGM